MLVVPLRQIGGQPIPPRHPHLRQLRWRLHIQWLQRRPSGLCQHLRHSLLSPHLPKWIPLPLHQLARPSMECPLLSPVVCRLLSMRRIYRRVARRWHIGGATKVSGCCRQCAAVGEGGRTRQSTLGGRWEGACDKGRVEVMAVRGGSRFRHPAVHCASADH